MPNIAGVLKQEITRLARKEARSSTHTLKKQSAQYRRDIAALKREIAGLEKKIRILESRTAKELPVRPSVSEGKQVRFSASGLKSQRKRLGLSAADFGTLLGVSAQSIYNWEQGSNRPRPEQVRAIAALRGIGKRDAMDRIEKLSAESKKKQ